MSFAQKRKSYNDHRLDYLRKQLAKHGDTPEKFWGIVEYWELEPLDAAELSQQVKWGAEAVYSPLNMTPPPYVAVRSGTLEAREPEALQFQGTTARREMRGPPARLQNLPREPVTVSAGTMVVTPKPAPVFRNFNAPPKPAEIPIKDFTKPLDKPK